MIAASLISASWVSGGWRILVVDDFFWKEVVMAKNGTKVTNNLDLGDLITLTMLFCGGNISAG